MERSTEGDAKGFCQCGCGKQTNVTTKGSPYQFLRGHHRRKKDRYTEADTGYETACWLWLLSKGEDGYGVCSQPSGVSTTAHRVYYQEKCGPIPEGLHLDHLCRIRCCVNPDHCEPVTPAENVHRGAATKLNADQVAEIRASTEPQSIAALRFGVSQPQISRIRNGKAWRS